MTLRKLETLRQETDGIKGTRMEQDRWTAGPVGVVLGRQGRTMFLKEYFGAFTTHEALALMRVLGTLTYSLCEDTFSITQRSHRVPCALLLNLW